MVMMMAEAGLRVLGFSAYWEVVVDDDLLAFTALVDVDAEDALVVGL